MTSTLILLFYDNYQPVGPGNEAYGSETYKLTSKPYSSSIGLYYDFHRWYDPSIGRFISPDQKHGRLSNPQSLNLYIYVLDRPTSLVDPTGLISEFHDRPCPASGCTSGPDPLFTAVSNWWNSLPPGEQQAIVFTAVVVIAAIVVVGTAGIASPLALAAVGAATSSTFYTATAGSHATLAGAVGSAVAGAVTGYFGGVGGAAAGRFGLLAGMLTAGSGAAGGDILGGLAESALGGRQFSLSDPRTQRRLVLDAGVSALTFGLGRGFRISDLAERLSERQVFGAGDSTFDWYVATPGDALNYQVLSTSLKAGWEVGTDLLGDFASSIGI